MIALLLTLTSAHAGVLLADADDDECSSRDGRACRYQDVTIIEIDNDLKVEGELVRPLGTLTTVRNAAVFEKLIDLRADFNEEMAASVSEIK